MVAFEINVLLGELEVDYVDFICLWTHTDQEVGWLDVSVNQVLLVERLKPVDDLVSYHENSF